MCEAESVGGGSVIIDGEPYPETPEVYPQKNFAEIRAFLDQHRFSLAEYVKFYEPKIFSHLKTVWRAMKESVERGLKKSGALPGRCILRARRKLYTPQRQNSKPP